MGRQPEKRPARHKRTSVSRHSRPPAPKAKESFWRRRWVKLASALTAILVSVVTSVLTGALTTLANNVITKLGPVLSTSAPPTTAPATPASTAPATPLPTSPVAPRATPTKTNSSGKNPKNSAEPSGLPLKVSEAPIDPGGNMIWMLPWKYMMGRAELKHLNFLLLTGQFNSVYEYLYIRGGYIRSADTNFMLTNRRRHYPIWVKRITAVGVQCGPALTGTLINASDGTNNEPRGSWRSLSSDGARVLSWGLSNSHPPLRLTQEQRGRSTFAPLCQAELAFSGIRQRFVTMAHRSLRNSLTSPSGLVTSHRHTSAHSVSPADT
jgi:hypothetical protein